MRIKLKILFVLIALFISFGFFSISCSKKSTEHSESMWKGRIEFENGIKSIFNPDEPVYGEIQFELGEDLVLGNEDEDNYLFYKVRDIDVDTEGNIFVLDFGNRRIQKFGRDGTYQNTIGREGEGPGDFRSPMIVSIDDSNGDIYVGDFWTIHHFDKGGEYKDTIKLERFFYELFVDGESSIWTRSLKMDEFGRLNQIEKISSQGNVLVEVASITDPIAISTTAGSSENMTTVSLQHGCEYKLTFSIVDTKTFIYGYSKNYELIKVDTAGRIICKIINEEKEQKFSQKEENRILGRFSNSAREKIDFPKTRPFFEQIFSDSEGRIYVKRFQAPLIESEYIEYDVFNKEGYYLYKTVFNFEPKVISRGYLYRYLLDEEDGMEYVVRYKINNWKQLNKEL